MGPDLGSRGCRSRGLRRRTILRGAKRSAKGVRRGAGRSDESWGLLLWHKRRAA